jgi:hypothetical protein
MDDRTAPATKGDIADTEERIAQVLVDSQERIVKLLGESQERIVKLVAGTEERIVELLRDVETKLLNAFYGYAKSNDKRVLEAEGNEAILRSRLATLETRVTEIEGRLNIPPRQ